MKRNNFLLIFVCLFTAVINASCPPGETAENAYEQLKAFIDNGVTTLSVPAQGSIYYLKLKSIIDNSGIFKNIAHQDTIPVKKLTFPDLRTDQVDNLLKLVAGDEMALTNREYLEEKIGRQDFLTTIQTARTADYLKIPLLAQIAIDKAVKKLQDRSTIDSLNKNRAAITELLSSLSPAAQKEIARKIISSFPYIQTHKLDNVTLYNYESAITLNDAGTRIAVMSQGGFIYDIAKPGEPLQLATFKTDYTQNILFNPANNDIITAGVKGGTGIINLKTGEVVGIANLRDYPVAFDSTGKKLALVSKNDEYTPAIKIFELENLNFSAQAFGPEKNTSQSFFYQVTGFLSRFSGFESPQDIRTTGFQKTAELRLLAQIPGFQQPVAFSPDNTLIAASSLTAVTLWNVNKNQSTKTINVPDRPSSLVFDTTGKLLAISMPSSLMIIDLESGKTLEQNQQASIIRFSADNQNLIFASESAILKWNLFANSVEKIQELPKNALIRSANQDFSVIALSRASDPYYGSLLLSNSEKNSVNIRSEDVLVWKSAQSIFGSLQLKDLIIFMIELGSKQLNKEYDKKLPQEAKKSL
ncbi:hypothetical protein HYX58_01720 [Candidatus Dependentiae bacterium]|nr:hypothetical protein [Candidatus Dependentiae bacterium]